MPLVGDPFLIAKRFRSWVKLLDRVRFSQPRPTTLHAVQIEGTGSEIEVRVSSNGRAYRGDSLRRALALCAASAPVFSDFTIYLGSSFEA